MKNLFIAITLLLILSSCTKLNNTNSSSGVINSLLPLKAGNTWVYQDSTFDPYRNLLENYPDTAVVTNQTSTISGITFYGYNDSLGYFGSKCLLAYDSIYYAIYQLDSLNAASPYVFFQMAPYDNYLLGTGIDPSNGNCMGTYYAYGFSSTYNVNGYPCYRNIDYEQDCNGNIITEDIFYVSPDVGVVRIEDYLPIASGSNDLYMDFSQTLQSAKLN